MQNNLLNYKYDMGKMAEKTVVVIDSDLMDIVPAFLDEWKQDIGPMRKALKKGDYETIRKLGHNLKGVGGSCGFDTITEMGASLETAAKNKNFDLTAKMIESLFFYLDHVEVIFE